MLLRRLAFFSVIVIILFSFASGFKADNSDFDILIKNGKIVNGTGNPWFYGDIGLKDGIIAEIGNLKGKATDKTIDASGLVVSPGFIDMHTHCDRGLGRPGSNANLNYLIQGVTTVRTGSCGSGTYKIAETKAEWEKQGIGTNAVLLVGFGPVRQAAMGEELRDPTPEEIKKMQDVVRQAMREGAWGISTGLEYSGYNKYVKTEEVIAVTKPVGEFDGVYTSHIRDEAALIVEAFKETIRIGEETGVPVNITHIKATGKKNWGLMKEAIKAVKDARARGLMVTCDQYPFVQGAPVGLIPSILDVPEDMKPLGELGMKRRDRSLSAEEREKFREQYVEELIKALSDKSKREQIRKFNLEGDPDDPPAITRWGWHDFTIMVADKNADLVGKNFIDFAQEQGKDMFDIVADLIIDEPTILFASGSQSHEDMQYAMQHEWVMVSSDGGASPIKKDSDRPVRGHPRDFSSQTKVLRKYVREENLLTLEDAIRKMTSLPAQYLKMKDRGLLLEGYRADIAIFNPETVKDNATYADSEKYSTGVEFVIIDGKLSVEKGKYNGALHGKVLLKTENK
ncbi:amidohydrolase family protein [Acidobacteriota bacterium]